MAKKAELTRTVQYWRLVDARDGARVEELDWEQTLIDLEGSRRTFPLEGREHAGTVVRLPIREEWAQLLDSSDIPGAPSVKDQNLTRGLVLAAVKDYVPNQENASSGHQQPMGLAGADWSPVDNLFVWHLPFGNMIGVLAESTSSSRAGKYADWLTKALRSIYPTADPNFAWGAQPVIDQSRAQLLKSAEGLRSFIYAGEIGEAVNEASGAKAVFRGGNSSRHQPQAIRIEVKASIIRGKSAPHDDEREILDWFTETFGALDGSVQKAQVTLSSSDDQPVTEVDLIHHRLTRKTQVPLVLGATRAFAPMSALGAIVQAFEEDRQDLARLRGSND